MFLPSRQSMSMSLFIAAALALTAGLVLPAFAAEDKKKEDPKKKEEPKKKLSAKQWREAADPLHVAAFENDLTTLKKLLAAKDVDLNVRLEFRTFPGYTPLHMAAFEGHGKAVEMLASKKADLNLVETSKKRTALHLAAANGRTEAVKALVKAGADFKLKDKLGNTALSLASEKAIIAELKKAGATE